MSLQFRETRLDNGLTIVAVEHDEAHTAATGFFVRTGSRDEHAGIMGVSHFLEHMMFKGTDRRTAEQVNAEFDDIGANYNASTSQEITCYWAHVLPEFLPRAIDLLSDILRPALRNEDFEMERNVILEEIGMYDDQPFFVGYEHAMEQFFDTHRLGFRILGTQKTITDLKREQMLAYFEQRYAADNIIVALSGKIDFDACVDQIQKACGHWQPSGVQREMDDHQPKAQTRDIEMDGLARHYMILLTPGPSAQSDMRYDAAVAAYLLGDADNSLLYWNLVDPGYADEADVNAQPHDQIGSTIAFASCQPDRAEQVESIMCDTLDSFVSTITDEQIERAKNKIATGMMVQNERPLGRMMALSGSIMYLGEYRSIDDELKRVMQVNRDGLAAWAEQSILQPRTIVRLKPKPA